MSSSAAPDTPAAETPAADRAAPAEAARDVRKGARRSALGGLALVAAMGALSFAAVPLYDLFCRVTGFGGQPIRADAAPDAPLGDRLITVRFDANTHGDMPWRFEPLQKEMVVRVGESAVAYYRASNPTETPVSGSATFNVTPLDASAFFNKLECFCFSEQTLGPGESVDMPVSFFVDPDIVDDVEHHDLAMLTLSYTFFRQEPTAEVK